MTASACNLERAVCLTIVIYTGELWCPGSPLSVDDAGSSVGSWDYSSWREYTD